MYYGRIVKYRETYPGKKEKKAHEIQKGRKGELNKNSNAGKPTN